VAVTSGDSRMVKMLLINGADPDIQDENGRTALILATENGDKAVVQMLLEKKAKLNVQDKDGRTALLLAAANGDKAVVELLLENGVDLSVQGSQMALRLAVENGDKEVVWLLAENEVKAKTARGSSRAAHREEDGCQGGELSWKDDDSEEVEQVQGSGAAAGRKG